MNSEFNKMNLPDDIIKYIFDKIIYPGNSEECWLWNGSFGARGYGQIHIPIYKIHTTAHRLVFECYNGQIQSSDILVCHKCDIRGCVNPDHLFLGTHMDNMNDMVNKRRYCGGENSHLSKLSDKHIVEMLDNLICGNLLDLEEVTELYNISRFVVQKIINRKIWKHITDEYTDQELEICKQQISSKVKLTPAIISDIKIRMANGEGREKIAKMYNINVNTVSFANNHK